jgi:hypothetical protein
MNVGSLERSGAGDENWEGWRFLPSRSQPVKEGGSAASEPGYQWAILWFPKLNSGEKIRPSTPVNRLADSWEAQTG